ncbi:AraC family transcriptional regulator [Heyndrickxia faecalis]|uniref:AraC family transcriptional regulator n=1 Tax=Heyndrickxia TaxID=2837504 RepID=UPI00054EB4DE|nr:MULTISPECIES: AraC family transcriptional regulator [Heyndrickxia]APB37032.1 AraC family transcriptional regulator [Heyndrickxia coagulans]KGT38531.1 transcriptional regulator [Heyndrickxia coagulans P38]MED4867348.1 AraC family transcriptional regulator [Weizmannia sp. CD-2023]QPG52830.1 AraC family transcriptional regulator [Heyndrickxia coagulans]WNE60848.1 AraC family transcriptional regulator [Heyndrickxia coagulans]
MNGEKKRYTFLSLGKPLPLFIESVGYNPREEDFARPEGYPYYHWLQTIKGEGIFSFGGQDYTLTPGKGILLTPFTPHSYYANGEDWSTLYITFGGDITESIMNSLEINFSAVYAENEELAFSKTIMKVLDTVKRDNEFSRLESSEHLYHFLILLKKYNQFHSKGSQNVDRMRAVVQWLETMYGENIGLREISDFAGMSPQYVTSLFKASFNVSPYAFLINIRIREAKKLLSASSELSLKELADAVGFHDASHFIATFKKIEGITPNKYRHLFNKK